MGGTTLFSAVFINPEQLVHLTKNTIALQNSKQTLIALQNQIINQTYNLQILHSITEHKVCKMRCMCGHFNEVKLFIDVLF